MTEHADVSQFQSLLQDPAVWVAISFVLFFAFFGKKLGKVLFSSLDTRATNIRSELDEARRLREEAENILALYRRKYSNAAKEAETILAQAREDANRMTQAAEAELKTLIENRTRMAQDKIAQAESKAIQEVRDHVVDITITAAKTLIMESLSHMSGDELVQMAIADIERKVH